MKNIQIKAADFFELLKLKDTSMWEIFAQLMDGEPKIITFVDAEGGELFAYHLPETPEQLDADRKIFSREFAAKLSQNN